MWFSGLAIGLPELLVAVMSVLIGIPWLLVIWGRQVWEASYLTKSVRVPGSLYMLTASVLFDAFGLIGLGILPGEIAARQYLGVEVVSYVLSSSLAIAFVLLVGAMLLAPRDKEPCTCAMLVLSRVLLVIALMGTILIIGCLPQAPWNRD